MSADASHLEVHQAEPFTAWYRYGFDGGFIFDGSWEPTERAGNFEYVLLQGNWEDGTLVAAVLRVTGRQGRVLEEADSALLEAYLGRPTFTGAWGRLSEAPRSNDPHEVRRILAIEHGSLQGDRSEELVRGEREGARIEAIAAVFPEQVDYEGGTADAWLFIVTLYPPGVAPADRRRGQRGDRRFARGLRGGRSDLQERVPELAPLSDKTVAVFGTGGVGAPSATELTRAGVGMVRLLDYDYSEPATSVRHPLGFTEAGRAKVVALGQNLVLQHPLTRVGGLATRIGAARIDGSGRSDVDLLNEFMDGVDLVYDATGDHGTGLFLCDLAFSFRVPYVAASTTLGAWGARVVLLTPHEGPCYACLLRYIEEEGARDAMPEEESLIPPADPEGEIRPVGCADATFTGTGFDVAPAALAGVRLAVSALCDGLPGAYPPTEWNVAILHLRDREGRSLAGRAFHHRIERHSECEECKRRSG